MSSTEPTRPEDLERVVGNDSADDAIREADIHNGEPEATQGTGPSRPRPATPPPGTDTPTGTDPEATYEQPGYEDKSLGQAVDQDRGLVDRILEETGGDEAAAERRFAQESLGRNALRRQASGTDAPAVGPD